MLSLYVGSEELQETECCHYMWDHKSCKMPSLRAIMQTVIFWPSDSITRVI